MRRDYLLVATVCNYRGEDRDIAEADGALE